MKKHGKRDLTKTVKNSLCFAIKAFGKASELFTCSSATFTGCLCPVLPDTSCFLDWDVHVTASAYNRLWGNTTRQQSGMCWFPRKIKDPTGVEGEESCGDHYHHAKTIYTNQSPQTESHADNSRTRVNSQQLHQRESGVTQVMLRLVRQKTSPQVPLPEAKLNAAAQETLWCPEGISCSRRLQEMMAGILWPRAQPLGAISSPSQDLSSCRRTE